MFWRNHTDSKDKKNFATNLNVNAVAVGNSLNYTEHAFQKIKKKRLTKNLEKIFILDRDEDAKRQLIDKIL